MEFTYRLTGTGWAEARLADGTSSATIGVSPRSGSVRPAPVSFSLTVVHVVPPGDSFTDLGEAAGCRQQLSLGGGVERGAFRARVSGGRTDRRQELTALRLNKLGEQK